MRDCWKQPPPHFNVCFSDMLNRLLYLTCIGRPRVPPLLSQSVASFPGPRISPFMFSKSTWCLRTVEETENHHGPKHCWFLMWVFTPLWKGLHISWEGPRERDLFVWEAGRWEKFQILLLHTATNVQEEVEVNYTEPEKFLEQYEGENCSYHKITETIKVTECKWTVHRRPAFWLRGFPKNFDVDDPQGVP